MPRAYAVVTYRSVSDPEKLAAYAKLALLDTGVICRDLPAAAVCYGFQR
jgi:hypothetical protein